MKFTTGAAIDPEARYLDHERVIRELEDAERNHELDAAGVIGRLKEAVATCQTAADRYAVKATEAKHAVSAYIIARGKYLDEIKRRVVLPAGGRGFREATQERPGWKSWCRVNGVSAHLADAYIAAARGDLGPIEKKHESNREFRRKRGPHGDRLARIRSLWKYLTPSEREEFLREVLSQKDYGPQDKSVAKTVAYQQREHQAANA